MGTASTMACILAALGMMPLKGATAPAVSSARLRIAEQTGAIAVAMIKAGDALRPQTLLTRESFLNAITVLQAIGGSTNAVVHLMAIINRHPRVAGSITLDTVDEIGRRTPLLVDLKPSGANYMTDFHNSGGMAALLRELRPLLHLGAMTVTGATLGAVLDAEPAVHVPRALSCVAPAGDPLYPASSLVVLRGNLAPRGAVMKASASKDRALLAHSGPAVVFSGPADLARRVDADDLDVEPGSVLVLQNIGPVGNPGMPEAGLSTLLAFSFSSFAYSFYLRLTSFYISLFRPSFGTSSGKNGSAFLFSGFPPSPLYLYTFRTACHLHTRLLRKSACFSMPKIS